MPELPCTTAALRRAARPRGPIAALIGLAGAAILGVGGAWARTPDIALTVHELLPLESPRGASVPGRARSAEPVTAGIPLSETDRVSDVSALTVLDEQGIPVPAQFRVLRRHASGSVQWVLVDFQADMPAGAARSYHLTTGPNPAAGLPMLAADQGPNIVVDTGAARFVVRKERFDMFHDVSVGGRALVDPAPGGSAGVVMRSGNTVYSSAADPDSDAVIEENGPLRTVVKSFGALRDGAGHRLMDYTVRLHFYRNDTAVKTFVTLRHAQFAAITPPPPVLFDSAEVSVPLVARTPTFTMSRWNDTVVGTLPGPNNTATLFQGFSRRFIATHVWACAGSQRTPPMERTCASPRSDLGVYAQSGLEIRRGAEVLQALGDDSEATEGWAQFRNGDGTALTVALRWMAGLWPAGFEMTGEGRVSVELFSKRNSKRNIPFTWGAHETRELLFDFSPGDGRGALWRLQYPLIARASYEQYAGAGAFFGERLLVGHEDHQAWVEDRKGLLKGKGRYSLTDTEMTVKRYYRWESPNQQHDHELARFADFYRTGFSGLYLHAELWTLYKADNAVRHSDGFDFSLTPLGGGVVGDVLSPRHLPHHGGMNGMIFDRMHPHWLSLAQAYYLTGNEIFREAVIDYGEYKAADISRRVRLEFHGGNYRVWMRAWRDFALLGEFTGRALYLDFAAEMGTAYLDSRDAPGDPRVSGRNLERGYFHQGDAVNPRDLRAVSQNLYARIHPEAQWEVIRVLRTYTSYPRIEDLEDDLEGLGRFAYTEPYMQLTEVPKRRQFGYWAGSPVANNYKLDVANPLSEGPGLSPQDSCTIMRFMYERTGDPQYLTRGAILLLGSADGESDQLGAPQCQAFVFRDLHQQDAAVGWRPIDDVQVTALGAGSYRLSWTVPAGADAYQVKYADKPIVEWLGHDQLTRRFQFDPDDFVAFFAASNIDSEPAPRPAGQRQDLVVSGLAPNQLWHFAIRYHRAP